MRGIYTGSRACNQHELLDVLDGDDENQNCGSVLPGGRWLSPRGVHFNTRHALALIGTVAATVTLLGICLWTPRESVPTDQELGYDFPRQDYEKNNSKIWNNRSSLFCFMVVQQGSMEVKLAKFQFQKRCGIFECTHYAVYSDGPEAITLGINPDGTEEKSIPIPGPPALKGLQSCLGCNEPKTYIMNANVLMRAWDRAAKDGIAGQHSWIVKVDADSMLSAPRLIKQIQEHGKFDVPDLWPGRFFKNCGVLDSMQGPVEVLSRQAFYNFVANKYKCYQSMDWTHMGEDVFVLACLKQLGVWSVHIDTMLHDAYCSYSGWPNCWEANVAVFHPLKDLPKQGDCWWKMGQVDRKGPDAAKIDMDAEAAKNAAAAAEAAKIAKRAAAAAAAATTSAPSHASASPALKGDHQTVQNMFMQKAKELRNEEGA